MPLVIRGLVLIFAIVAGCHGPDDAVGALEERLLAPCCWRQSLRDHESPIATQLRAEIRQRVAAGDSPAQIEADFVRRYGEEIRALPRGKDPRWIIGVVVATGVVTSAALLVLVFRRRRRPPVAALAVRAEDPDDAERLDDELARVD